MISKEKLPELKRYRRFEKGLPIRLGFRNAQTVVANGNERAPIHRWFRFKEAFSADLFREILGSITINNSRTIRVLDPFCGVGTTLLSAQELSKLYKVSATGIEQNPLIAFVAQTKLRWPEIDDSKIPVFAKRFMKQSAQFRPGIPSLSSLTTGRCMSRHVAQRLVALIQTIRSDGDTPVHHALLLGIAGAVEQLSRIRKDGRALRIVSRNRQVVRLVLAEKWSQIASDVRFMRATLRKVPVPDVILGDGRIPRQHGIESNSIDLILTSPPYPNNIDYSEVYKLELWLLEFVKQAEEFLALRRTTFRSHPTAATPEPSEEFLEEIRRGKLRYILQPLLLRTECSLERHRHRLIVGYSSDIWTSLKNQYNCLKRGGRAFWVVGNSLHGGKHLPYLIPTDIIVCAIGECLGFKIDRLLVARSFRRRLSGNHFLRESIITLRK